MHFYIEHSGICYQKYPRKNLKITLPVQVCRVFRGLSQVILSFWLILMNKKAIHAFINCVSSSLFLLCFEKCFWR